MLLILATATIFIINFNIYLQQKYVNKNALSFINILTEKSPQEQDKPRRTLVFYAYFEKNDEYKFALKYFIELGVEQTENIDYILIIQGKIVTVPIPDYKNVRVFKREHLFWFRSLRGSYRLDGRLLKCHETIFILYFNQSERFGTNLAKKLALEYSLYSNIYISINGRCSRLRNLDCLLAIDWHGWLGTSDREYGLCR